MTVDLKMPSYEIAQITNLTVSLEPVQDLHGYDSPWPAGGGKNLLNYANAVVTNNSTSFNSGIQLAANQAYTFSYYGSDNVTIIGYVHGTSTILFRSGYTKAYTFTPTENASIDVDYYSSSGVTSAENLFQLEIGGASSSFTPYSNICPITGHSEVNVYNGAVYGTADDTYTISLGGTYYGGTLDVLSGVLTVDRAMVDLGTLNWVDENSALVGQFRCGFRPNSIDKPKYPDNDLVCSQYPRSITTGYRLDDNAVAITNSQVQPIIRVRDSNNLGGKSVDEAKAFLSGVQLVYELATPTTVQLTAQDVEALIGINNVWSDSGNVSVTIYGTTQTGDVVTVTALPQHKIQLFMP